MTEEEKTETKGNQDANDSQCSKDSDCDAGYICVRGKCIEDIGPPPEES